MWKISSLKLTCQFCENAEFVLSAVLHAKPSQQHDLLLPRTLLPDDDGSELAFRAHFLPF